MRTIGAFLLVAVLLLLLIMALLFGAALIAPESDDSGPSRSVDPGPAAAGFSALQRQIDKLKEDPKPSSSDADERLRELEQSHESLREGFEDYLEGPDGDRR